MKDSSRGLILLTTILFLMVGVDAIADPEVETARDNESQTSILGLVTESERFSSFEPNYAILQSTEGDDLAIEAHYSFRYRLFGDQKMNVFLAYTGEFDFYAQSRDSSPVINRLSNPAFHFRRNENHDASWAKLKLRWWGLGIEHLSNGQVAEAHARVEDPLSANYERYLTQVEFEAGNREYFDTISRGSNFLSAEALFKMGSEGDRNRGENSRWSFSLWVKARVYLSESSDITWGPQADQGIQISHYDKYRIILSKTMEFKKKFIRGVEPSVQYSVGRQGVKTHSLDANLLISTEFKGVRVPIFCCAHYGPNDIFSDYTKIRRSYGVGLLLR